jgi:tRNA A37 threonylcarbamoyladenosine dehydratase
MVPESINKDWQHRTRLLVGDEGMERLRRASVAVIGLGGVGGYAVEALARAGVGRLLLVDCDTVDPTNINRQIIALDATVGMRKTDATRNRVAAIHPGATVETRDLFVEEAALEQLTLDQTWHVIDAIDMLDAKVALLRYLHGRAIPCVSSMGAGLRLDPSRVQVADVSKTRGCPLARQVRQRLRGTGIHKGILCVFSDEPPLRAIEVEADCLRQKSRSSAACKAPVGSISYLPALFGLTAAGTIINAILKGTLP